MLLFSSRPQHNSSKSLDYGGPDQGTEQMVADRSRCPRGGRDTVPLQACKQNSQDMTESQPMMQISRRH